MYNPSLHTVTNKAFGMTSLPLDARSYYYDEQAFEYRPYASVAEALNYLKTPGQIVDPYDCRKGQFSVYIQSGGKITEYWFKDGVEDFNLVPRAAIPDGGTTGQALVKTSDADGDAAWQNVTTDLTPVYTALSDEVIQRNAAILTALQAEVTNRNSAITTAVTGEANTRQAADLALKDLIDANTSAIASSGNQKVFDNLTQRNAYNVTKLPLQAFVLDDGDGKWALYQAVTTGVNASYVKLSDPDLLNAAMTAAQIKAAYESNPDTNALTNTLLLKLNGIANGATANSTDAYLLSRANHTGTQAASTIVEDSTHRFTTDTEKVTWNAKQDALGYVPVDAASKGQAGGVTPLDGTGKVSATYLPSYVDDVVEAANFAALPAIGETGKIYITLNDNKVYRWSGSAYIQIVSSPGSSDAVPEGTTNKYFTEARVLGTSAGTITPQSGTPANNDLLSVIIAKFKYLYDNLSTLVSKVFYTTQTASFSISAAMVNQTIRCNFSAAGTITIPDDNQMVTGQWMHFRQSGIGALTVSPAAGITINAPQGLSTAKQYSSIELVKQGTNIYSLTIFGDDPTKADLTSAQTVAGVKTFSDNPVIQNTAPGISLVNSQNTISSLLARSAQFNTLTLTNKVYKAGGAGGSMRFNGTTQFGYSTNQDGLVAWNGSGTGLAAGQTRWAVSVWFKTTQSSVYGVFFRWGAANATTNNNSACEVGISPTGNLFISGNGQFPITAKSGLNDGKWHHAVFQNNGTNISQATVTIDNVVYSLNIQINFLTLTSSGNVKIGSSGSSATIAQYGNYAGELQQVLYYVGNLSTLEVSKLWNNGNGTPSPSTVNLSRRFDLGEGTGAVAADSYNSAYNLSVVGVNGTTWNISGKVAQAAATQVLDAIPVKSADGINNSELGEHTFGEFLGGTVLQGLAIRYLIGNRLPVLTGADGQTLHDYEQTTSTPDSNGSYTGGSAADKWAATSNAAKAQVQLVTDSVDLTPSAALIGGMKMGADGRLQVVSAASTLSKVAYTVDLNTSSKAIASKTSNYTLTTTDHTILADATAGAITLILPPASTVSGKMYIIKKTDATANTVTVDGNVSELIDGQLTKVLSTQNAFIGIQCDGAAWYIINS